MVQLWFKIWLSRPFVLLLCPSCCTLCSCGSWGKPRCQTGPQQQPADPQSEPFKRDSVRLLFFHQRKTLADYKNNKLWDPQNRGGINCDLLVLHVTLMQEGVHHIKVHGGHMDVNIDVDGHRLSTLGAPEVNLQMAPKTNTWACRATTIIVSHIYAHVDLSQRELHLTFLNQFWELSDYIMTWTEGR